MTDCRQCEAIAKQLAEVEKKLAEAEKERDKLKAIIKSVAEFVKGEAVNGKCKMEKGDIGRAEWGFNKAQFEMGNVVLALIGLPKIKLKTRAKGLAGIGQDLFSGLFGG